MLLCVYIFKVEKTNLNVEQKTINTFRKKIGDSLGDLGPGEEFLELTPKAHLKMDVRPNQNYIFFSL